MHKKKRTSFLRLCRLPCFCCGSKPWAMHCGKGLFSSLMPIDSGRRMLCFFVAAELPSQCQGERKIQCISLCLCSELTHHFYLQPIPQTGPKILSNCQGTGKFGEALNTQRAVKVSTTQSLSSLVFFKLCLIDPWALQRCITSSVDNDVQSTKCWVKFIIFYLLFFLIGGSVNEYVVERSFIAEKNQKFTHLFHCLPSKNASVTPLHSEDCFISHWTSFKGA